MSEFGVRLRQARENQGFSLAQAAMETKILQQWLVALEEGSYDRLSNDVVARGFIRNYVQFLGLPVHEMLELYRRERGQLEPMRIVPATKAVAKRSFVLPGFFAVFFITIVLVGITYTALSAIGHLGTSQIAQEPVTNAIDIATPIPMNLDEVTPQVQGQAEEEQETIEEDDRLSLETGSPIRNTIPTPIRDMPTPTLRPIAGMVVATPTPKPAKPTDPIIVEVSVDAGSSGSWLRVQTDGTTTYENVMRSGERRVFNANQRIQIRAGNPTVVNVRVNGMPPEVLGGVPGRPANWSWPPM